MSTTWLPGILEVPQQMNVPLAYVQNKEVMSRVLPLWYANVCTSQIIEAMFRELI